MTLTIYGSARSRTLRVLWMAAELGLDYIHVPLAVDDPALKQSDFLRINPAGGIPAIEDDGFALSESLAINLYLAKKYGGAGGLYPRSLDGEADLWRWTLWAQAHLEPWLQRDAMLSDLRAAIGRHADAVVARALARLDGALAARSFLIDGQFTVGDLNVASVLSPSRAEHLDLRPYPHVGDWIARCRGRPAAVSTRRRFLGETA
jgi:glutathione S-transferase